MTAIEIRALTTSDIPSALTLCAAAYWNQTAEDWRRLLEFEPSGCFAAFDGERLVGTATTTRYEPASGPGSFGWIGMMLVDPAQRRRGIGSALFQRALDYLEQCGVETIRLDATQLGKPVYDGFGFQVEYELERWKGEYTNWVPPAGDWNIAPAGASRIDELADYNAPIFGARRVRVLEAWRRAWPDCALVARKGESIAGYVMARRGLQFQQIGPVIGDTPDVCASLLCAAFERLPRMLTAADIVIGNEWGKSFAEKCGLTRQRPLTRMFRGPNRNPGRPQKMLAICCPELG